MRIDEYAQTRDDAENYISPFAGLSMTTPPQSTDEDEVVPDEAESPFDSFYTAESPFDNELPDEADTELTAALEALEALHDEEFEDALEDLINEGAAHGLADEQQWQAVPSEAELRDSLEQWVAPLATEWERLIDEVAAGLDEVDVVAMSEDEIDEMLDSLVTPAAFESEVFDEFIGKWARKIKNVAKSAIRFAKNPVRGAVALAKKGIATVKSGIQAVGKHILGPILRKLKGVGLKLLKGVVSKLVKPLTRALPAALRPFVPVLMKRLGAREYDDETDGETGSAAQLSEAFDEQLVGLLFEPETDSEFDDAGVDTESLDENEDVSDELAELDDARARLAAQLTEYSGSEPPIAEIEQFIPAVLAIRPLLKLALTVTGARGKLVKLIAKPLAKLIRGMIGAEGTRRIAQATGRDPSTTLARAAVGVGLSALGLEAAAEHDRALAGEALASAVEATVLRVADELPEEAQEDPLQVSAAVQRAFAEAAASYLPDGLLRADLPERETAQEGGVWILLPRAARPRYRFRKYTKVFPVTITRQVARAVPWSDGGTLESYLLDRGATSWPVRTEVDLYETLPGTLPGHFTRDETLPMAEHASADEFQPLTTESAGLLLGEPALGRECRCASAAPRRHRAKPGQRFYRVRAGRFGKRTRRPRRLVAVRWEPTAKRLRIIVRLSEQRARTLQAQLQRRAPAGERDVPAVLSSLRAVVLPRLQARIARRLVKSKFIADPRAAAQLAGTVAAATTTALSAFLAQRGSQLATAVADPADGVTLTVTFTDLTPRPAGRLRPAVTVRAGMRDA